MRFSTRLSWESQTAVAITLTETAAGEIKRYMETQKLDEGTVLRVAVAGGGCSGLQYSLGFENGFDPVVDAICPQHGVTLVVSKKVALHMDGTTIDFQEGPMGRGFSIENPNIPRGGGCPGCGHH
jgi:iron-sulfur cluster assembly protein